MDIREIQNLIRFVAKSGASEVKLEMENFKITIKTTEEGAKGDYYYPKAVIGQPMMPQQVVVQQDSVQTPPPVAQEAETTPEKSQEDKYITIKSPMIGTFYRKSAPQKPVMVEVGDIITPGKSLCIIEAMKLFNEIESEISGKIVKVLVEDATPVEYDQPLFLVDPS